jgi:hypothetical protein
MPNQPHIIQKSSINLQFNGRIDGFALQKEVDDWCHLQLLPLLDKVLQPYAGITEHIRIDRLEITVEAGSNDEWKSKLTQDVIRQIKEKLEGLNKDVSDLSFSRRSAEQNFPELLVFYLEKGYLPWWSLVKTKDEWLEQWRQWLKVDTMDVAFIKTALQKETVRLRLVHHLPADLFYVFAVKLNPVYKDLMPVLMNDLEQITAGFSGEVRKKVIVAFQLCLLQNIDVDAAHILQGVRKDFLQKPGSINDFSVLQTAGDLLESNAIFISNAGQVIVATFLPVLFNRLGISENGKIKQPATALCLLHYLLTGTEDAAEFELVLPKILCGIEVGEVIDLHVTLTREQKTEADNLLLSVIEHWSILKNTSIIGLRESFLKREGKLSFQNEEWLLLVEQKPFDMLLQHIPWNINLLKLSWMKHILRTEWA